MRRLFLLAVTTTFAAACSTPPSTLPPGGISRSGLSTRASLASVRAGPVRTTFAASVNMEDLALKGAARRPFWRELMDCGAPGGARTPLPVEQRVRQGAHVSSCRALCTLL